MKIMKYEHFDHVADPNTEEFLLPLQFRQSSNSDEFAYRKFALNIAVENCLDEEQKQLLQEFYWQGKTKTEIAKSRAVVPSTIVKRIKSAEKILKTQLEFALKLYENQKENRYLS